MRVSSVRVTAALLVVAFDDGRSSSLPLAWYPRLLHGSPRERNTWQLIARGHGVHWPLLDEDLSAEGLLAGRRSCEGPVTFDRWLAARALRPSSTKARLPPGSRPSRRELVSA